MVKIKKSIILLAVVVFTFSSLAPVLAVERGEGASSKEGTVQVLPEREVIYSNHEEATKEIRAYIDGSPAADSFVSLHISRNDGAESMLVLSFTSEISAEVEQGLNEVAAEESVEVQVRQVANSMEALQEVQDKISSQIKALEEEDITIDFIGVDVISNRVEVGLRPYNDATIQTLHNEFGDQSLIRVVEGSEMLPLDTAVEGPAVSGFTDEERQAQVTAVAEGGNNRELAVDGSNTDVTETPGLVQTILQTIAEWWQSLWA